ncbi:GNAT family N-acetyltransferase [Spirulina sp. CCNP1310]|uniref:GNAT family N-acetyltransferase n=1 Tax=Spirulina sp. CCNP1310 TaxID=3110249 RepID=UPI002B1ECEDD|nr:GNAT family N-acetyltransferase [Spirulina sp. CCNP1310]MEA5418421.1 GNAT family N-acetyltransferase [Spirulina sp. CCNP1310]
MVAPHYRLSWHSHLAEIPQPDWDALALPLATPFLEWEWLHNLETSGSVTARAGWQPCHLTLWRDRTLIGAAPLYLKSHSYGEFVFDHQWADLSHRLGLAYYPKLVGMTPITPAVGYRFLIAPGEDEAAVTAQMMREIDRFCDRNQLSGANFLFVDPQWRPHLEACGLSAWLHHSYIWSNREFQTFDDYLKIFNSNQRKNIKRERKAVQQANLRIETLTGSEIPHHLYPQIYQFYSSTCDKFYWGSKYLTRKFFEQLYPKYSDRVVLFVAYPENQINPKPVGMSFCLRKGPQFYGRYWGCFEEYDCLHFETCYYKPIEWAISQGITDYDPGAGGRHKRRRGFPAMPNYSLHRFYDPRISKILHSYIDEINTMEQQEIDAINADLPFNKQEINFHLTV